MFNTGFFTSLAILLQKKSIEAEIDALREEYHQRVSLLERKVTFLLMRNAYRYGELTEILCFTINLPIGFHI